MVKVNLELPDWVDENELYIHSWTELVALKRPNGKWYVKTGRCNMCGDCCRDVSINFPYRGENGTCIYLKDNKCIMDLHKPFSCIMDFHDEPKLRPINCTETFKEV